MIRLVLNNQEVELTGEEEIDLVFQLEDTNNPTIVKNTFSKSITLKGTKKNNKIFGDIYRLDREQQFANIYNGIYFDPSKRVSFELYNDNGLLYTGYFQLDSIDRTNDNPTYTITLYGGIGNFFYNLEYDDEGEKRNLASLNFGVTKDKDGKAITDHDKEFDITIDKSVIYDAFNYVPKTTLTSYSKEKVYDWLTFIPSYNGKYEDFSNDKAIINTNKCNVYSGSTYQKYVDSGTTYTPYDGYALAELAEEVTEWDVRDLRSYKQRPALRVRRLIEAINKPENNGGYTVDLDKDFFNDDNPYWNDSYIALPLMENGLNTDEEEIEDVVDFTYYSGNTFHLDAGSRATTTFVKGKYLNGASTGDISVEVEDDKPVFDVSDLPSNATFNARFTFNLTYAIGNSRTRMYLCNDSFNASSVGVQIVAYNAETNQPIKYSKIYTFCSKNVNLSYSDWNLDKYWQPFLGGSENEEIVNGYLENGRFYLDGGASVFELDIEDIPNYPKIYFLVMFSRGWKNTPSHVYQAYGYYPSEFYYNISMGSKRAWENRFVANWIGVNMLSASYFRGTYNEGEVSTRAKITKETLLTGDKSPADYLLSYTKMFNLYYVIDEFNKKVSIKTRKNFFNGTAININDWIDRSKDFVITPLTFDYKWYNMALETESTKYADKYNKRYDLDYGCKRINTSYNFTAEENDLYDDNAYTNGVTVLDSSSYYYNMKTDKTNYFAPTIGINYYQYHLYALSYGELLDYSFYVYPYEGHTKMSKATVGETAGFDAFPKICYFDTDKAQADFSDCLVLRNGIKNIADRNGDAVYYSITDDIPEMRYLNDDSPCYYVGEPNVTTDKNGKTVALWTSKLPVYTKYATTRLSNDAGDTYTNDGGSVAYSLDFGAPRETYMNWQYNENATIYNRFLKELYEDQYNINTRKVSCYVRFKYPIDESCLRNIYYFDNSYWILNEVEDYSPSKNEPVKCEFIRVRNKSTYTNTTEEESE